MATPKPGRPSPAIFAAEYVKDFNATQAAIRAGYSESTAKQQGSRLLTRVDVQRAVSTASQQAVRQAEERVGETVGSVSWIVTKAVEVVDRAMRLNKPGIATPALALLSRMHPEFSEKHEVTGDVRLRVEALAAVAQMTPDQLRVLAERARSE